MKRHATDDEGFVLQTLGRAAGCRNQEFRDKQSSRPILQEWKFAGKWSLLDMIHALGSIGPGLDLS
jgi:hypothetical protein